MKKTRGLFFVLFTLSMGLCFLLNVPVSVGKTAGKTLDNLMAAFNGESNARAKYLKYAQKADSDGYGKIASLFRAAASAEEIHLNNHSQVISSMGGTAKADIKLPEIKSTKENLQDALKGENYERLTMYPEFVTIAQKDKNKDAVQTFTYAKDAETEHAKLYKAALGDLGAWKVQKTDFHVCPTCGYTVMGKPGFTSCPICKTPAKLYQTVN